MTIASIQLRPEVLDQPIVDLSSLDLILAAGLVLVAVGISRWQGLGLGGDLVVGAVRTVVQLTLVGYVLVYLFALDRWYLVLAALGIMIYFPRRQANVRRT